jgi:uncharacterized protein involved in exopolysaccharide biosynthesis
VKAVGSYLRTVYNSWYAALGGPGEIEPTFASIFSHLWKNRGKILLTALIAMLLGFIAAQVQSPRYVATLEIIPNIEDKAGISRILNPDANTFSSLFSSPFGKSERVTPFEQFNAIMMTPEVAGEIERRLHILRRIYPRKWDAARNRWKPNSGGLGYTIKRFFNLPAPDHPDRYTLLNYLKKHVDITEDKVTATITVTYTDVDQKLAIRVLQSLYSVTEGIIIKRDKQLTELRLAQAQKNLTGTMLQSDREALTNLLTHYHLQAIQAEVGSPYAALRLLGPEVQPYPTDPNVLRYMLVAFSMGLLTIVILLIAKVLR